MNTTIVAASATTVTVTLINIPDDMSDESVIERTARAASSYGIAEDGHRISRQTPTASNPIQAVVTLDRKERAA